MEVSEELNTALAKIVESLHSGATTAANWTMEQLPDVIRQLILFKTVQYGLCIAIGGAFLFLGYQFAKWAARARMTRYMDDANRPQWYERAYSLYRIDFESWGWIPAVSLTFVGTLMVFLNLLSFIKILVAPKVWLLEYAINVLSSSK